MTLKGIDVSGFQSVAEVAAVIDQYDYVGVKATEGLHSVNSLHAQQVALVRSKGKRVQHYHFFHPGEDAAAQWAFFKATANLQPGDHIALDAEDTDGLGWTPIAAGALTWLQHAKADTLASPELYVNLFWRGNLAATPAGKALETFPLWLADYTRDPSIFGPAAPWPNLTMEQWTDNDHGMDGDVFLGDGHTWDLLGVPAPHLVVPPVSRGSIGGRLPVPAPAGHTPTIHLVNVRPGYRNADVRAFNELLWAHQGPVYKRLMGKAWMSEPSDLYGPVSQKVVLDTYRYWHAVRPAQWPTVPSAPAWPGRQMVLALGGIPA